MKTIPLKILMYSVILLLGCNKKNLTNEIDITQIKWELKSLVIDGEEEKTPSRDNFGKKISNDNPYLLVFENEERYAFNLGINDGGGEYKLPCAGIIEVETFSATKLCCDSEFDKKLKNMFRSSNSYTVLRNRLIFQSATGTLEFKKK